MKYLPLGVRQTLNYPIGTKVLILMLPVCFIHCDLTCSIYLENKLSIYSRDAIIKSNLWKQNRHFLIKARRYRMIANETTVQQSSNEVDVTCSKHKQLHGLQQRERPTQRLKKRQEKY